MWCVWFILVTVQLLASPYTRAEVFTALVEMESLLETEGEVITFLTSYIQEQEIIAQKLKLYLQKYEKQRKDASQDIKKYIQNPINAFLMVKSLSSDWQKVEHLIVDNNVGFESFKEQKEQHKFPSDEDLSGAAAALMRLQDTYKLETSALARGQTFGTKLKPSDCYELGRQADKLGSHYHTVLWMQESLDRISNEKNATATDKDILEYLAHSNFMLGDLPQALKIAQDLFKRYPDHSYAARSVAFYEDRIQNLEETIAKGDESKEKKKQFINKVTLTTTSSGMDKYEQLCRGEKLPVFGKQEELFCRYTSNNHPFHILLPFKEEIMSIDPYIGVYHDLMSDSEIEVVKELSAPKLNRAQVRDAKTGGPVNADYRISKSAWLHNGDHPVIERISRRLEDATGLTMSTAEPLQVVNYGIGGHYTPHFDFSMKEDGNSFEGMTGNRIATVLFYMSDVEAGGATVFPEIGVTLWPRKVTTSKPTRGPGGICGYFISYIVLPRCCFAHKALAEGLVAATTYVGLEEGSAAFWYNLHKNGEGDFNTKHAACPVLFGTKWVSNKWIHEHGQEFRYPCGLSEKE